jgi:hypothetical protein
MSVEQEVQDESKAPSREEMIKFYKDQIELKELQCQLQELNTRFIRAKADEIQATAFIGQMMSPQEDEESEEEDNAPIQQNFEKKLKRTDGGV